MEMCDACEARSGHSTWSRYLHNYRTAIIRSSDTCQERTPIPLKGIHTVLEQQRAGLKDLFSCYPFLAEHAGRDIFVD